MMESMSRFGRGIGRHPMPIPHSEDSETDEYNVIDSDRQYERIGDRGSSSTGTTCTSSSRSSNNGALVDPLIGSNTLHGHHSIFHQISRQQPPSKIQLHQGGLPPQSQLNTHYAESAIYRRSRGIGSPVDQSIEQPPPLIPESQLFMSAPASSMANGGNNGGIIMMDGWKSSQHSTLEFGHLNHMSHLQQQQVHNQHSNILNGPSSQSNQTNTTILSTLDSGTGASATTTTTASGMHPSQHQHHSTNNNAPVYESTCLMRTASGSLYIPSDNKGAFLSQKPLQSINEFTIGGTLKKPDRYDHTIKGKEMN